MKPAARLAIAAAVLSLAGCSKEALQRTGYETLHNISDAENDIDPGYNAERPAFDEYQRQRQEALPGRQPSSGNPSEPLQSKED